MFRLAFTVVHRLRMKPPDLSRIDWEHYSTFILCLQAQSEYFLWTCVLSGEPTMNDGLNRERISALYVRTEDRLCLKRRPDGHPRSVHQIFLCHIFPLP